ncbi:MAG TPA: MoaD/ThiS family protein [Vicinamibacterales bacterium]|nr:MoaD/ThiS family protein [Vicinamibacterales bacterium]
MTVRLPSMLHAQAGAEIVIDEPVHDVGGIRAILERDYPALAAALTDPIFNVAVNDVMLLHGVQQYPVKDGDVVEIVPTIAGG